MILTTMCYIQKGNQTLMLHRNKKENDINGGKWIGVGGKFDAGDVEQDSAVSGLSYFHNYSFAPVEQVLKSLLLSQRRGQEALSQLFCLREGQTSAGRQFCLSRIPAG